MAELNNRRGAQITRRGLLLGGAAVVASMAACSSPSPSPSSATKPAAYTFANLISTNPFFVAHRGGGRNWPEMTAYAYDQAAALPYVKAIEISVVISADGVLVCSHDPNTIRVTGVDHEIEKTPWSTLSELMVTAAETDDPSQPARPLTRFDDVIDAHIENLVCFVEPKTQLTAEPLMERMIAAGHPERVVWKQPITSGRFARAKEAGFHTWGHGMDESRLPMLARWAADPNIDMLGVGLHEPDAVFRDTIQAAKANGKKVITWPVMAAEEKARALQLGISGLMTSDIVHVPPS